MEVSDILVGTITADSPENLLIFDVRKNIAALRKWFPNGMF